MGRIFTLRNEANDALEHLNGKMFKIKIDKCSQRMVIVDATDGTVLRLTTSIVSKVETSGGYIITTESGQRYDLADVATLLPSKKHNPASITGSELSAELSRVVGDTNELGPIKEIPVCRHIDYGDGYRGAVYTFAEDITEPAFEKYLISAGEDLSKLTGYAWYEQHPKIIKGALKNGDKHEPKPDARENDHGRVWTYIIIDPYTD